MFISTFAYENIWFHPRMIPHSKPAESTSCSKITDTTSIAIDLSQALRGNSRVPFLQLSRYKHSGDISTIEISLQNLICLIFVYGINIFPCNESYHKYNIFCISIIWSIPSYIWLTFLKHSAWSRILWSTLNDDTMENHALWILLNIPSMVVTPEVALSEIMQSVNIKDYKWWEQSENLKQ